MQKNDLLINESTNIQCVMHKDIEEDSAITLLLPMRNSKPKSFLFFLLVVFTGGVFYLLCYWFPSLKIRMLYTHSPVESCTHIYAKSKYYKSFLPISKICSNTLGELIVFSFQELSYYFDGFKFQPLFFNTHISSKFLIDTYGQGHNSPTTISEFRLLYGSCILLVPVMPLLTMIVSEIFNPFYVFQVYSVVLWYFENYITYAVAIVVITVISLVSSITTTRRGMIALHNLAKKECKVIVTRSGKASEMSSIELVPGDLVEVTQKLELPCDMCLISGGCIVEEGMLTGESVPVLKDSLPYMEEHIYDPDVDKRHTLYEGTRVIQTRNFSGSSVLAVVVRTGFSTVKGRLIRSIMYPKPNKFKFYEDSLKFIGFLAILTLIGFSVCLPRMIYLKYDDITIALRFLDLITITVPPALPACMAVGVAFAVSRLKKDRIYCIAPNRVNVAGRIDMFVFDKTGTLTEDGMNLLGVQSCSKGKMDELIENPKEVPKNFLECMATCHSLAVINKELIGDTQDLQIFRSTGWMYEEPDQEAYDPIVKAVAKPGGGIEVADPFDEEGNVVKMIEMPYELGVLHIFHFTSKLKRMGVITKNLQNESLMFYCKGAPEVIIGKCSRVPKDIDTILAKYTRQGYRVLACGGKELKDLKYSQIRSTRLEDIEGSVEFLGLIILQNKLKKETKGSLELLQKAKIRTIMATGDAVLTGISVARECGLVSNDVPVYLGELEGDEVVWEVFETDEASKVTKLSRPPWINTEFTDQYILALTGSAFARILKSAEENPKDLKALNLCLEKCQIYARMAPEHKTILVEKLQDRKYLVGMCGDGANDCGALKTADVGVSLSESDSSIAAPFTSQIANISSVITVLREGRCALTTSIQCFKFMALYSMIQFTSVSMLYWYLGNLTNNQFLLYDLFTVMPLAVFMSKTGPCKSLSPYMPTSSLVSIRILTSVSLQAILQALFQVGSFIVAVNTYYSLPNINPGDTPSLISYHDTVICYISWFEYQVICAAFSIGKPWKKPSHSNYLFTSYQVILIAVSICGLFIYNDIVSYLLTVKDLKLMFKFYLLGMVVIYAVLAYTIEKIIVPWVDKKFKKKRAKKSLDRIMTDLRFEELSVVKA